MKSCKTCRHSFPVTSADAERSLVAGVMGNDSLSLLDNPSFAALRTVPDWRGCKPRVAIVPASSSCAHYSPTWMRLFASERRDAALYASVQAEITEQREAEIRAAREATATAERDIRSRPCASCGFLHARCADCTMPWPYCGRCERCGGGVRFVRTLGSWECSLCEAPATQPPARQEWPEGRCDSCRAVFEDRHAARQ